MRRFGPLLTMLLAATLPAQERQSLDEQLLGVWNMELRVLRSPLMVQYQEDANIAITEKLADGSYRVMARVTSRLVVDEVGLLDRPDCYDKKECVVDDATEGLGRVIAGKLHIDWSDPGWIDDVFTIGDRVMEGDDGNGPIKLYKVRDIAPAQ